MVPNCEPIALPTEIDLHTILDAWNTATERLQQTHELLRAEVKRLTDELEAKNRELARKNRLADLGQMASHVAHEVRNGLVPMKLYLNLLRRRLTEDQESLAIAGKISAGFTGLETVVNDLMHFTSQREPQFCQVELPRLIHELCDSLRPQFDAQGIELELSLEDVCMSADVEMLRRGLLNLVLNAIDVMPQGGRLTIQTRHLDDSVSLTVADTGPGLDPTIAQRIFEPFFTTKGTGTGLGLAIVERIAQVHGGEVKAENRDSGGAQFSLRIPQAQATRRVA